MFKLKKIISLIMICTMVMGMSATAFAGETKESNESKLLSKATKAVLEKTIDLSIVLNEKKCFTFDDGSSIEVSCNIISSSSKANTNTVDYEYKEKGIFGVLIGEYHLYTVYDSSSYYVNITDTYTTIRTGPGVIGNRHDSTIAYNNNTSAKSRGTFTCSDALGSFTRILTTTLTGGVIPTFDNNIQF